MNVLLKKLVFCGLFFSLQVNNIMYPSYKESIAYAGIGISSGIWLKGKHSKINSELKTLNNEMSKCYDTSEKTKIKEKCRILKMKRWGLRASLCVSTVFTLFGFALAAAQYRQNNPNKFTEPAPASEANITISTADAKDPETPVVIFFHGFGADKKQADDFIDPRNASFQDPEGLTLLPSSSVVKFDFPDVGGNISHAFFAQDGDTERVMQVLRDPSVVQSIEKKKLIFCGFSRGGGTAFSAAVEAQKQGLRTPDAIIAISPLVDPKRIFGKAGKVIHKLMPILFPRFDPNGTNPIDCVDKLPKKLPILLVHSKKDSLVSIDGSEDLSRKLKEAEVDVDYLKFEQGNHVETVYLPENFKFLSEKIHEFFRKHSLHQTTNV
jgi:predicted esterase